ncbi:MAG: hypothetical protein LQ338_003925 [Usnochroma carphineum]|nr:MAG: hypothetical protein LQ338_003925 [Usnochroma carphineum]
MASIDPVVASVLDTYPTKDDLDEDDLLDSLENDPTLHSMREQRMQQLHEEFTRAKHLRNQDYGQYTEIKDEKTLMDMVNTGAELCATHFFKSDFHRCAIMDGHLEKLAPLHFDTRFLRINVENAPFLVTKLKVQVLPCVIAFKKGVSIDRIIGFEGLGYSEDTFSTQDLERRLVKSGVLVREKCSGKQGAGSLFAKQNDYGRRNKPSRAGDDDDDDDDWD